MSDAVIDEQTHLQTPSSAFSDITLLFFTLFSRTVRVECRGKRAAELLQSVYAEFRSEGGHACLHISVTEKAEGEFQITMPSETIFAEDEADFIFFFEKELTLAMERERADLYFIHGAVLYRNGATVGLIAPSGSGKSTTAWALLHHGFEYLSDELIPVDPNTMQVSPYPHALCVKKDTPAPYPLPKATLRLGWTLQVPTAALPARVHKTPERLTHILFVRYDPNAAKPSIQSASLADTARHIYTNGLNQLAHNNHGLQAAAHIASKTTAFQLITADLAEIVALVATTLDNL